MEHVTRRACRYSAGGMAFSCSAAICFVLPALSYCAAPLRMTPLRPVRVYEVRWRE